MYEKIVNPKTNRLVNVNSKLGKSIIKSYYNAIVTGGSSNDGWENPLKDPEATWLSLMEKLGERIKKRKDTPETPFSMKLKFVSLPPITVQNVNASDTVNDVVSRWLVDSSKPQLARNVDLLRYYYYPEGPNMGSIALNDGKRYTMGSLKAGRDSMIQILPPLTPLDLGSPPQ